MTTSLSSRFQTWSRKVFFWYAYYRSPRWDTGITPPELMAFIDSHPPGRALDLGCGTGTNVITLAKNGWQVVGVDFITKAVRKAKKKIQQEQVQAEVFLDDVSNLQTVQGKFDLIYDIGCYHNLSQKGKYSYEMNLSQFMKPGSTYLLYGFLKQKDQKFGITDEDITRISFSLTLVQREDGEDLKRPSTWLEFQFMR